MSRYNNSLYVMPLTPTVRGLIIINVVVWVLFQLILEGIFKRPFTEFFALNPFQVIFEFRVWEVFTYMFLHSSGVTHIVFNMLMLWFMGSELESHWGKRNFLAYYLSTGVGAALIYCVGVAIYSAVTGSQLALNTNVVGASGAIFGLMLAQAILFGERIMYFFMLFPMKTKYFVMILGVIELASLISSGVVGGEVAYLAHLGGLISGYLYLFIWTKRKSQKKAVKKEKTRNLKLVVNNEKKDENDKGPRYWN